MKNLNKIGIEVILHGQTKVLSHLKVKHTLINRNETVQIEDPQFKKFMEAIETGRSKFRLDENGVLWFRQRICVLAKDVEKGDNTRGPRLKF